MTDLAMGDVVKLKSGGHDMTVQEAMVMRSFAYGPMASRSGRRHSTALYFQRAGQ
jgi:hypothetical protein